MLGISYGELFLLLGATAALIGPKDLPLIARTAGRLAGRAIGYVQLARGQFDNIMQQTQARQVHKELQDTLAQLEAIRHEIRAVSFLNPGPLTRRLVDNVSQTSPDEISSELGSSDNKNILTSLDAKSYNSVAASDLSNMHTQATSYARLAQSTTALNSESKKDSEVINELTDESGLFVVLPVSAESTGMLPERKVDLTGSDVVLEAILEANVACNAKQFFAEHQKTN
ncbi:sec-independent protein translocase protein TatB [Impatiens glandulifera]|uniref:sec-independent protein translocase protein TatB n=1 Tax=Impatiens glandulifera TaxID=253017 RepID=UPI001FB19BDD|nr:sec-independent protein translocase protein TatB [Impatiens glandulifera]